MANDDEELGEMVPLDGHEDSTVRDTEDGGAIVTLDDAEEAEETEFYANLAETLPSTDLTRLASTMLDLLDRDKESRKRRDEQYEEGLRRTGLGEDAPGGASFQGATKVVHPMLTEACVDFAARAMKEVFPNGGPVKDYVPGRVTDKKIKRAKRKTALLNWQMTVQCEEVRAELEQMMTQLPLGGAQYLKVTWEEKRNRPSFLFVAIDDMLLPYAATNFYTAQRRTHVQYLTQLDYQKRVKSGMYRDVDLTPASMEPEQSKSGQANDRIEGREASSYNEDGLRTVFEIYAELEIEGDDSADGSAPYILTIDKTSGQVLALYRNWAEDDEAQTEMQSFVEFPFIPWRGAYPIGLPHMIGGLSAAATGSLRALLDSAHISNSATMLKLKGGQVGGQNIEVQPTQVVEIEGGIGVDDIRKLAMPMPFNPPSGVLYELLGFVVEAGKGVVRTSMEDIAESNQNAPVGTTLAKIEQGMVVFSAIHGRLCDSMTRLIRILDRLNGRYLDNEALVREAGEELATREDFQGPLDVIPVSDPNIFSEAQRFGQVQAISQRAQMYPQLYNQRKIEERILQVLKVPDSEGLLMPEQTPKEQNAVAENVSVTLGQPIIAFPEQDHLAHLNTHLSFMTNPMFGQLPIIAQTFTGPMLAHLKEHMVLWYATAILEKVSEAVGRDVSDMLKEMAEEEDVDHTEEKKALEKLLSAAAPIILQEGDVRFAKMPPIIQQAQQMLQQFAPNPAQQDPRLALEGQKLQATQQQAQMQAQMDQQKLQQQAASDQQKAALAQQELQIEAQRDQQQAASDQQKQALEAQREQQQAAFDQQQAEQKAAFDQQLAVFNQQKLAAEVQGREADRSAKLQMNEEDNQTAAAISAAEIDAGQRSALSTGTGINPGE